MNPGETIGEIGMLTGSARSASIRAVRNSLLLRLTSAAFDRLARQRPDLTRHIAGSIAGRLRDRTAGVSHIRRTLKTIALLPLGPMSPVEDLSRRLCDALDKFGSTCLLTPRTRVRGDAAAQSTRWPPVRRVRRASQRGLAASLSVLLESLARIDAGARRVVA